MKELNLLINKLLHLLEVMRVKTNNKEVYLTFDDGPEEGITEFVLSELKKYNYKATFFCKGENAEIHSDLLAMIKSDGHVVGNHTFSHIHGFETKTCDYVEDVERASKILHSHLFRPPWGALRLSQFLRIKKNYSIVYWSLLSGDTLFGDLDVTMNLDRLIEKTKRGDVVLFHFCQRHQNETKQILPAYLEWLNKNGYISLGLK